MLGFVGFCLVLSVFDLSCFFLCVVMRLRFVLMRFVLDVSNVCSDYVFSFVVFALFLLGFMMVLVSLLV